jgi:hypothetical protein
MHTTVLLPENVIWNYFYGNKGAEYPSECISSKVGIKSCFKRKGQYFGRWWYGSFQEKSSYEHVSNSEFLPRNGSFKYHSSVNSKKERWFTYSSFHFTFTAMFKQKILYRNDKSVTVHNKCSKNPTVRLDAICNSCAKIACCASDLIFTFLHAGKSLEIGGSNSSCVSNLLWPTFLCIQPHRQKSNAVTSGDSSSSISVTIQN